MCALALTIAAAATTAIGTGFSALQANAQSRYQAKVAERNADMEREAARQEIENTRQEAMRLYRERAKVKGAQRLAAAAGGTAIDFGTAGDLQADTDMLADEDVNRLYKQGYENLRGRDIQASNFVGEANARRSAGTAALVKGAFDMGSTVLGGAQQYRKLKQQGFG